MARRATFIKDIRSKSDIVLLVDAGNSLWGQQPLAAPTNGKAIVEAYNRLGYDAVALGDLDISYGREILLQRMQEASFVLLSANAIDTQTQFLFAAPYVLIPLPGGHQAALIGLTHPDAEQRSGGWLKVRDPETTLQELLPQLTPQADIFILLSNLGLDWDQKLAENFPSIDVIIGGKTRQLLNPPRWNQSTRTVIAQAGSRGEWIGKIVLNVDSQGNIDGYNGEIITLGPEYQDDPDMRAWLNQQ